MFGAMHEKVIGLHGHQQSFTALCDSSDAHALDNWLPN